jgi:alanine dehydrogenase
VANDVVHYCVTNMPGQFPRTASSALSAAVAPRLVRLVDDVASGAVGGADEHGSLAGASNVDAGRITHPAVADAFPDRPAASR